MSKLIAVKKNGDFKKVIKNGHYAVARHISVYIMLNGKDHNRIGIIIKKKLGKSVIRNYIRRVIKQNYRELENDIKYGFDIVIIGRVSESVPTYGDMRKEMEYAFRRLHIIGQE